MRYFFLFLFSLPLMFLITLESHAVARNCSYKIYVNSKDAGIKPILIYQGEIKARGRFKGGAHSDDKMEARKQAAIAAKRCMDTAMASNETPKYCKPRDWVESRPDKQDGIMIEYNIPVLKSSAFNTICDYAHKNNKGNKISGIQIYSKNVSTTSKDTLTQCRIQDSKVNDYYTPIGGTGLSTECSGGTAVGLREQGAKTRWTGSYDERGSEIRTRIKNFCKTKFNLTGYTIN